MTLTITIDLDNDAFGQSSSARKWEVRKILDGMLDTDPRSIHAVIEAGFKGNLRDSNGNTVGAWKVEGD